MYNVRWRDAFISVVVDKLTVSKYIVGYGLEPPQTFELINFKSFKP